MLTGTSFAYVIKSFAIIDVELYTTRKVKYWSVEGRIDTELAKCLKNEEENYPHN